MLLTCCVISRLSSKTFSPRIPSHGSKNGLSGVATLSTGICVSEEASSSSDCSLSASPVLKHANCLSARNHSRNFSSAATKVVPTGGESSSLVDGLPYRALSKPKVVELRKQYMAPNQTYFFKEDPLLVMRAKDQYLYDENGVKYLDCINNVAHIGHCHPQWAQAVGRQLAEQSTNVRYLHPAVTELASRLAKTMPPASNLSVTYFVNSGSEAIDLALRLARAHTGGQDVVVLESAYHGTLTSTTAFSPYKYHHLTESEKLRMNLPPDWVHIAQCPDPYRGHFKDTDVPAGQDQDDYLAARYTDALDELMTNAVKAGRKFGIFIAESIQSCGGQVVYPEDYLRRAYAVVRKHGGLCVADEVQCGFGRVGSHYWGFEIQNGAIPDIVIVGKSMGNGFPVAGVITRPDIAASFARQWPEFFNTYAGNPVSATAALAVMDVIESEHLREHAAEMGVLLQKNLSQLADRYPEVIGQIRGRGLMYGIDIVTDSLSRNANKALAVEIKTKLRLEHNVIVSTDGPYDNVIKIKPPMCFNRRDVLRLTECMDQVIKKLTQRA